MRKSYQCQCSECGLKFTTAIIGAVTCGAACSGVRIRKLNREDRASRRIKKRAQLLMETSKEEQRRAVANGLEPKKLSNVGRRRLKRLLKKDTRAVSNVLSSKNAEIARLRAENERLKHKQPVVRKPHPFYDSRPWRELRYLAIKKHGRKCMACGETRKTIHVDHIKPRSKFPELELILSNLQILCVDCNMGKSNKDDTDWREDKPLNPKGEIFL